MRFKNYSLALTVFIFCFWTANKTAAQLRPVSYKAVKFAESIPVRDMPAFAQTKKRKVKPTEIDDGRINEKNEIPVMNFNTNLPGIKDPVLSSSNGANRASTNAPNVPSVSFDGISIANTFPLGQGYYPPDPTGAAGLNQYVQAVNVAFQVWDKTGTPLTPVMAMSSLWAALGPPANNINDGDPIVLYDQLADRWIISQFDFERSPSHQLIAISKNGDATGAYYLYDYTMPNAKFNDYPKFGVWTDGYYMSDNQFTSSFVGEGVFVYNKAKMLVGDPTANYIYFDLCPSNSGCFGGLLPSSIDGFTPPPAGAPNVFTRFIADENGDPMDGIRLYDFHADFAVPANSTFTERTGSPLSVPAFDPRTFPPQFNRNIIPQPATSVGLDAIPDRLMYRLAYRNFGSYEALVLNHTVDAASYPSYRAAPRFYELTRTTPAGAFTVTEAQTFDGGSGSTDHRWMGSVAMNYQGDIALGYSVSSSSVFPSIRYAAKLGTDPTGGGLAQGEQSIMVGSGIQTGSANRWGDYTHMSVDPSDDCSFWYTNEYLPAGGGVNWQTRVAKFAPGTTTVSPRGTISGTITTCAGAIPIANALVSISGGFSRATLANGTYSAILPPGSYIVTVTAPTYGTVTSGTLVVTNGGNTVFNACLAGVPAINPVSSSIAVEGCAPANGAIDPTETVTVNFCLNNTGTANTTNLVATLLSTGGISSPSGPQTYGVVVAGGASVCQPFTFSNTGICGGTITATFQLQDGATNLGTISYTFNLGSPSYSTGLLPNGGFETGDLTSWTIKDNTPPPVVNSTSPHTGTYAVFIGNPPGSEPLGDASIYQTLSVPPTGGTLSFWYNGYTEDGITFDWQDAYITDLSGNILATIMHVCTTNAYTQVTYNLLPFAGQTVRVEFLVHQDGFGDVTNMYVDDVTGPITTYTCCGVPPPCVLTCPANITVNNDAGQCGAVVNYPATTLSGACGTVTSVPASGSFFPKGTTTVTSTSQSGATCTFTITVNDTQLPTETCPANQTRSTNNNVCTYTAVGTEFNATASDNCPGVTKAYTLSGATTGTGSTLAGVVFNKGVTTVTWVPTDASANVGASCSFTVTVNDNQVPNLTCQSNQTRNTPPATCTYTASGTEFDPLAISDNCVTVTQAYTLSGVTVGSGTTLAGKVFNIGVTTVSWTATDGSNNTSNCSFTVTIVDSNLPVITTQPANKTVCEGDNATFSVVATSPALITYQWQQWNGSAWVNIAGATSSSYTVNSTTVAMNTNSYRCNLTDICGGVVTSGFATLYVNKLPVITLTTSRSPALIPGQFLTITANVNPGGGTIVWRKNGVVITGYNAFWIPNLTVDDIGTYDATYTDLNGCVKSSASVSITAKAYDKLFVYPNPNDGTFQVRFYNAPGQSVTVIIYDSKGAKVYQRGLVTGQLAYSAINVSLPKLSSGVYVVDLMDASGNRVSSKRIIISH